MISSPRQRSLAVSPRRLVVVGLAIALGLLIGGTLAVLRSGVSGTLLGWVAAGPYEPRGQLVALGDGRRIFLDCRGVGSPTVIFESGMGGDAGGWGSVFPRVTEFTRACVYDRAGRGRSDSRTRHTGADAMADLSSALAAAGEREPLVLVGHSLGGVYVRLFGAAHPESLVGIVMVDAFSPDLWVGRSVALPADVATRWKAALDATFRTIESVENLDWAATMGELSRVDLGELQVIALTQPSRWALDEPTLPAETLAELAATWEAGLASLSRRARHVVVEGAGHFIQYDRPDVVVAAVRELVDAAR